MKTLYLHVGTPKTATSSIQKFLQINREILEEYGYFFPKLLQKYPNVGLNRNAHFMVEVPPAKDGAERGVSESEVLQEGMEQVADAFGKYDHVILSEEGLWRASSYSRKELFPYLKEEAGKKGYQIKIIVYLRRQDQFVISNWNQCVKHGRAAYTITLKEYLEFIEEKKGMVLNYAAKLDQMAEIFGKENLIVRRFEPQSWVNHSVIHDFMDSIGLTVTDDFQIPSRIVNPGLSENYAEIKRMLNEDPAFSRDDAAYLCGFLRNLSAESKKRYPCSMLSPKETQELLNRYAACNQRVAEEYIGDGKPLFSGEISQLPKWKKENPYMAEDMIRFLEAVFTTLRCENQNLKQEITSLRQDIGKKGSLLRRLVQRMLLVTP